MCEYCTDFNGRAIPLDLGEKALCEWVADEPGDYWACAQSATWRVYVRRAECHLCPLHLAEEDRRIDEAGGHFLSPFGVQTSVDFLPVVKEAAFCDHVDFPWEGSEKRCGRPVTHVKMVTEEWLRCDEHAALVGYKHP